MGHGPWISNYGQEERIHWFAWPGHALTPVVGQNTQAIFNGLHMENLLLPHEDKDWISDNNRFHYSILLRTFLTVSV